jgi:NitT/TauT family transport system ATP-binding protein
LIHNPSLLLLDEPFRMLDPLALEQILDGFQRLWAETETTALLCTCNMLEAVLLSDRVAVLSPRPGRILQDYAIELPRPRRLDKAMTPQIAEYCNRIRILFRAQGVLP